MKKYRILSFDGGGLKGLISLGFLSAVSEALGAEDWLFGADLYAGTSTGGLIALALAAGKRPGEIRAFYQTDGPLIFDKRSWTYRSSFRRTLHAGYGNGPLSDALGTLLGERTLGGLDKKVLIASFDLCERAGKRRSWAPKIFNNYQAQDADLPLRTLGLYTSAAPTFLPTVDGFVDGGVCANNPSMCALAQALNPTDGAGRKPAEIRLVSVGTGTNPESIARKNLRWGVFGWNVKLLKIIMDGSVGIADYQCRQTLSDARYLRLQADLAENIDMDDASRIPALFALGARADPAEAARWAAWIGRNW